MANPAQDFCFPGFWYDGAWRSGSQITLDITDPGLLYGATVFSTLRIYENSAENLADSRTAWGLHRSRLSQSVTEFGWTMPDWHRVETGVVRLAADFPVVRVTLFPDGREWIVGRSLPEDLGQRQRDGIVAWVMDQSVGGRSHAHHKTGNYLTPWFGLHQAQARGAQETILTAPQGNWLETCTGSLWGWVDGVWHTPSLAAGILPGIARDRIISGLRCQNREVLECHWDADLTRRLTIVAYSNCVVEVVPIRQILRAAETLLYPPRPDVIQELSQALVSGDSQMR
jgi:branched-subunit amino acid aminotransferase/4-amino-4-deoxychorismate lyase